MANEQQKAQQGQQAQPPAPRQLAFPSDDQLKAMAQQAKKDTDSTTSTTSVVAALVLLRAFQRIGANLNDQGERNQVYAWLRHNAHGLGSNASQFGAWADGKATSKKEDKLGLLNV